MRYQLAARHRKALAEFLAVLFMSVLAFAARKTGFSLLLFPELAALSYDVFARPRGKWATQPIRLILTPTITGAAGLLVSRHVHFGVLPALLVTMASLLVIRVLRSAIAPAISAGLLPLILGERHWGYPVAIFAGLTSLAVCLRLWKVIQKNSEQEVARAMHALDDALEEPPLDRFWLVHLLCFVGTLALAGQYTGLRFILFPPLVVMAYELFGHPELPGWMKRPILFPLTCFATAAIGFGLLSLVGNTAISVGLTVALSIAILRVSKAHMPPALAVGLLPFVMDAPNIWYPLSVSLGTATLCLWFLMRSRLRMASFSKGA